MSGGEQPSQPAGKAAQKAAMPAGFFTVAAIAFALLTIASVNVAVHPQGAGNGRGAGIAGIVLFFAMFCLFTHLALQAEHHWHWHRRGGQSADPAAQLAEAQQVSTSTIANLDVDTTGTLAPPHKVSAVGRRYQRHGPYSAAIIGVVLLGFTILSFTFLFQSLSAASRSNEVQKHGIRTTATVVSIHHVQHADRYSTWYTADITAALADGRTTVVHDNSDSDDDAGTPLTVLIDPKDHNYAEFPGQPKGNSTNWIIALIFILVSGSIDFAVLRGAVRMIRKHRQLTA